MFESLSLIYKVRSVLYNILLFMFLKVGSVSITSVAQTLHIEDMSVSDIDMTPSQI